MTMLLLRKALYWLDYQTRLRFFPSACPTCHGLGYFGRMIGGVTSCPDCPRGANVHP
jgi:hypothetical protein